MQTRTENTVCSVGANEVDWFRYGNQVATAKLMLARAGLA